MRSNYCFAVQRRVGKNDDSLYQGCLRPGSQGYESFKARYDDRDWSLDRIRAARHAFSDPAQFYLLLSEPEFAAGWLDAGEGSRPLRSRYARLIQESCPEPD